MNNSFVIYRPPKTTGRLEGDYYKDPETSWRPSLSYKHTIRDVRDQFTPAENFRHVLQTSGKQIRLIQRLEIRMNRNFVSFLSAAVRIQSLFRGNVSRTYYKKVKGELYIDMLRRQSKANSTLKFRKGKFQEAIDDINAVAPAPSELLVIKMKCEYRLKQYMDCIATSIEVIGKIALFYSVRCA
jgi:hypothetical protein